MITYCQPNFLTFSVPNLINVNEQVDNHANHGFFKDCNANYQHILSDHSFTIPGDRLLSLKKQIMKVKDPKF